MNKSRQNDKKNLFTYVLRAISCGAPVLLSLLLLLGTGDVCAEEYIDLSTLTVVHRTDIDDVQVLDGNQKIIYGESTKDNWVVYKLNCKGEGTSISFHTNNDFWRNYPGVYVIQFESFGTNSIDLDNKEYNGSRYSSTGPYDHDKDITVTLNATTQYVAIAFDHTHKVTKSYAEITEIKITQRTSPVTYTKEGTGDGTVTATRDGANLASGSSVYACDEVTFTATTDACSTFEGWYNNGTRVSTSTTYTYPSSITSALAVTAKFTKKAAPTVTCKDVMVLSEDGRVSVDWPSITPEREIQQIVLTNDKGLTLNKTTKKLEGTLPFGDNVVTLTAAYCEMQDQCTSHIKVVKEVEPCAKK